MPINKKIQDNNAVFISTQVTDLANRNLQAGTDITIKSMELFRLKGQKLANVGYEQAKGNLFEYIEASKFLRNNANAGNQGFDKYPVTDVPASQGGYGGHTAPDDFRFEQDGKVIFQAQAKVNNDPNNTANNFVNPKYNGMQKITTSDTVEAVKTALLDKLNKGEISKSQYNEAMNSIRSGLTDERTGVSSGGTTTSELKKFCGSDGKVDVDAVLAYAKEFEYKQMAYEIAGGTAKGAVAGGVIKGAIQGVTSLWDVYNDRKKLDQALKETGMAVGKGAVRGGAAGFLSSIFRITGKKQSIPALTDTNVTTALAAAVVDCGVSIYAYAKGEIDGSQLVEELKATAIQSSSAYYFTAALKTTIGVSGGVFLPMAIYTATSYMLMSTKAIIDQAKLNAIEYRRVAKLYDEETAIIKEYRQIMNREFAVYRKDKQEAMQRFLSIIDTSTFTEQNYSQAIYAMVGLSNQLQYSLQHKEFAEFDSAMKSQNDFVLR